MRICSSCSPVNMCDALGLEGYWSICGGGIRIEYLGNAMFKGHEFPIGFRCIQRGVK